MRKQRVAALARLIDTCEGVMIFSSTLGLGFTGGSLWLNAPTAEGMLIGVALLFNLACFWVFFRRLNYEHEWLTRYDPPAQKKE